MSQRTSETAFGSREEPAGVSTPDTVSGDGYEHAAGGLGAHHEWLLPTLERHVAALVSRPGRHRAFDLGCGNGAVAHWLAGKGWEVAGVDPSKSGIASASRSYPGLRLEQGSCYDDLAARFGQFELVVSLEVVEHLFFPRIWAQRVFELLVPGGTAIVSTPYHGYWKNLALAVTGRMDAHFCALWDYGHIKFWSAATFGTLLSEAGLRVERIERVGRISVLAKAMVASVIRPEAGSHFFGPSTDRTVTMVSR
ncbi:MAG: class I SAM-dependent methyltransferase [Deltaproteobacteria bacterium]|nr:class I SAM-dependent methyltransferase [Deltaproteobacteria bacterium]